MDPVTEPQQDQQMKGSEKPLFRNLVKGSARGLVDRTSSIHPPWSGYKDGEIWSIIAYFLLAAFLSASRSLSA